MKRLYLGLYYSPFINRLVWNYPVNMIIFLIVEQLT